MQKKILAKKHTKVIFITGGVLSSLGKGLAAASLAYLLERRGLKVSMLKMDPYINVDPGTMSPTQHGEVFVTDDGAETDLDLGHYERFTSLTLTKNHNFTTGQVYLSVIENEREGKYLGKTVQVVPHITDEIRRRIELAQNDCDVLIAEIGGTVGDIESLPFIEAIRQERFSRGDENVLFIHLVLLPYIRAAHELKTKPAQHSVKELMAQGIHPDMIICRSEQMVDDETMKKISSFCNVKDNHVFQSYDVDTIYQVPLILHEQGLDECVVSRLNIWTKTPDIGDLQTVVEHFYHPEKEIFIGIVGKYTDLVESYKSLDEALNHGALAQKLKFVPVYIDSEKIEGMVDLEKELPLLIPEFSKIQGILVPGGFGARGTEGKIKAIQYAREKQIPFLGICLGLQLAVIEFARHVANIPDATSEEFQSGGSHVIHYMEGQSDSMKKGGNMRLGSFSCTLTPQSKAHKIYQAEKICERHRHRLEVNNFYINRLMEMGLVISGFNPELNLVEMIELNHHPFFVATQFHPEFKSKPFSPHPLFFEFIKQSQQFQIKKV